ncbi:MAG: family 16 glycoside hydrolase [Planctomycetaceae bacterium]
MSFPAPRFFAPSTWTILGRSRPVSCGMMLMAGLLLASLSPRPSMGDDERKVFETPKLAEASPDFALQGEYVGENSALQVIALGAGKFQVVILKGGLPGAGWDGGEKTEVEEDAAGLKEMLASLNMKKVHRASKTLGAKPPKGAVVLFDGTPESVKQHWKEGAKIDADSLLVQGCTSVDLFQDCTVHIEFRTPFMPYARGQGRGNSGIYYQGRYETQMLDSFGLAGKNNETGGIYTIRDPDLNMCFPPLSWQTYDADYTAARFDEDGKKIADARLTVRLNGVIVQNDVPLPHTTTAAPLKEGPEPGPIYLQDHGNQVRYQNIWVLPRDADREAVRPIIPGFERFHAQTGGNLLEGGRLLAGELACTKCHQAGEELAQELLVKEPPVLTEVGGRVHADWIQRFLNDPHGVKPGSTMPNMLASLPDAERAAAATAITNFLASTGKLAEAMPDPKSAQKGANLFHSVGCVQCHAPRDGRTVPAGSSVPLGEVGKKYSIPSLSEFLKNPHKVRSSGRMPAWPLKDDELRDIATYLVGEVTLKPLNPNLKYTVYHGDWTELPNFDELKAVKTGESAGFDLRHAGRGNAFAMRFDGFLPIEKEGKYTFHIGSDDGSRLLIGGKEVVKNDGIHPHGFSSGSVTLTAGVHELRVEYFEGAGEESLELQIEGPRFPRQDAARLMRMTAEPVVEQPVVVDPNKFVYDPSQVEIGRKLFTSIGCASCHELKVGNERLASTLTAKPLADCNLDLGCLSTTPTPEPGQGTDTKTLYPQYDLSPTQTEALSLLLSTPAANRATAVVDPAKTSIERTMTSFNCYACHTRGGIGGATTARNELFLSNIPEMGDEGRVPPPLDGVGDKLEEAFLKHLFDNGGEDRPYMQTKMPKFGNGRVGHLAADFAKLDLRDEATLATFHEPEYRVKSNGRQLVGDKGLACIKCHTFGNHKATGIQAINLHSMTRRLREDWFLRYLYDPATYRPGTRMPTGFPNGQAAIRDVYAGDPNQQISALWIYLKDAGKAGIPDGLIAEMIELKPEGEPIIYRNFIDGLSPRGIAVGYPERAHLAWDANDLCLKMIWHGRFIDASKHWVGRGPGNQTPLGDHVMRFEETVPVAVLANPDDAWPTTPPKERGYRFKGYALDSLKRPTFQYQAPGYTVTDFPEPIPGEDYGSFRRTLTIDTPEPVAGLTVRLARASKIEDLGNNKYKLNDSLTLSFPNQPTPVIRDSAGQKELLLPLKSMKGTQTVTIEMSW